MLLFSLWLPQWQRRAPLPTDGFQKVPLAKKVINAGPVSLAIGASSTVTRRGPGE